MREPPVAREF
uniref:Uncharacterized protein n=1 Tax=Arundo donax TaxID=35708 RepID=A0A0A9QQP4_ARUDO